MNGDLNHIRARRLTAILASVTVNSNIKTKLLAMFVALFVCLNAGGALCVAYCTSFEIASDETEHCPLKKTEEHCNKQVQGEPERTSLNLATGEVDCCPMAVSFFAAPIEKNSLSFARPALAAASQPRSVQLVFSADRSIPDVADYRGPPPLDRRGLRIRHRIIRI